MKPAEHVPTNEQLCRAAAKGDADALQHLMLRYHGELLAFLERKLRDGWKGKIDADDVLQETYINIVDRIGEFEYSGEDSFYIWSMRIADHRFIDRVRYWRRTKRASNRESSAGVDQNSRHEGLLDRVCVESTTPSVLARRADAQAVLMSSLACLPQDYRHVLRRLYLDQVAVPAVAAELGKTPIAVHRIASRAIAKLRESMGSASRFLESRH
jgi:RNA polymerase sigma-70 factor (ECF subfamily)